ncbi:MAG: DUF2029 domain-containing protein [Gemmatimonadetes bacterium]|nr:DUF2029 domain-containing protein [Gemmatimonadota bacterium]
MMPPREERLAWVIVLTVAFLARLPGIGWGLPDASHHYSYHPDEIHIAGAAERILETGDLNPHFFNYGTLPIYATAAVAWPGYATGLLTSPRAIHRVARWLSLLCAVATVGLAMAIARRAGGPTAAALAGFFVAAMPGHILHSAFATPDVPATFLVMLCIWLTLRARDTGTLGRFALAGVVAGLAAATKYNAGLVLLVPVVGALGARRAGVAAATALAGAGAAFLVAMPYALLDAPTFREHVMFEFDHARRGHGLVFRETGNGWIHHLRQNLPYLTTVPLGAAALAGVVIAARRRGPVESALLLFAVPYFALLGLSEVRFLRYLLPLAPALAILAALPIARLHLARTDRRRLTGAFAVAVVTLVLAVVSGSQQMAFFRPDPRTAAARWLAHRSTPGTGVALVKVPWHYTPPLTPFNGGSRSLADFRAGAEAGGADAGGADAAAGADGWAFTLCRNWNVMALTRDEPEYVVLSEFERREEQRLDHAGAARFLRHLDEHYEVVASFDRIPADQRWLFGPRFAPHDWLYPFTGIEIWKRTRG